MQNHGRQSLPSRERELKRPIVWVDLPLVKSLPSRERELKPPTMQAYMSKAGRSLPSRERELKHRGKRQGGKEPSRSPRGSVN